MSRITDQSGFVSLFTVIFFMLLVTVVTVGFLRIMAIEQRQALDNDLSASARAAAESGIEDGKRAILKYYSTGDASLRTKLLGAFSGGQCNGITGDTDIRTALGLNFANNIINNNADVNEGYTCLTVNLTSDDYLGSAPAGKSEFIPLKGTGGYNEIRLSWHLVSDAAGADGDGPVNGFMPGSLLYPQNNATQPLNSWSGHPNAPMPAYLRVQLYGYPNGNISRGDLEQRSRTMFLVPSTAGTTGPISFETVDPGHAFETNKLAPTLVRCTPAGYACTVTLQMPGGPLAASNNNYFVRVTPIYGQSHFRLQLLNSGTPIQMNEVQPVIDATGKAADVFRRLQVRVRIDPQGDLPEYVVESADTVCKDMQVSSDASSYVQNCP